MTKLLDTTTGELVEIPASDVLAARKSGRFGFSLDRPVPIIQNGEPKWIPAKLADQYRSSLTFTDDDTVFEYNAKERMSGIGGVLAGAAYGGAKGLTLGLSPLLMKAAGYGDLARDIELGAGNSALTAEVASLGFNPLAAFGRGGGKAVAKGAGLAAEHAAAAAAAPAAAEGAVSLGAAAPVVAGHAAAPVAALPAVAGHGSMRLGAGPPAAIATAARAGEELAPLRLGQGHLASGVADTSIGKALRSENAAAQADEAMLQKRLPAHQIEVPESPFTLRQPPFESALATDIQNSRANTLDRLREVETQLSRKRPKGRKALLAEREELQGHLDEYEFMEMKFSGAEENALAEQAGRADVARRFGDQGLVTAGELRTAEAGHADLELAAQRAEQARARNRMGQGAPDIIGRPVAAAAPILGKPPAPVVDLAGMTQQELAEHFAASGLPKGVTAYDALTARPSLRGKSRAEQMSIFLNTGVDVARDWAKKTRDAWVKIRASSLQGIEAKGVDSTWNNFHIGVDIDPLGGARNKAYATLSDPLSLSGTELEAFLVALRDAGYNGQAKVPSTGARMLLGFDNIVMHGATKADAAIGEATAKKFFGNRVEHTAFGVDAGGDSHSGILAKALEARLSAAKPMATGPQGASLAGQAATVKTATGQGVPAGRELVLGQPRPGVADVLRAEQTLGKEAESMAAWDARTAEAAMAEDAAWREAGGTRAATQVERDIAAAEGVAPGRELAILPPGGPTAQGMGPNPFGPGSSGGGFPPSAALGTQIPPVGAGLPLPPAGLPSGVAGSIGQAASGTGSSLLRTATEGAIYGGASQASREQLGLEEGAPGSVMKAALLGGGLSGAIHLGLNAASRGSLSLGGVGTGGAIGRGLKSLEDTHIMRGLGNTAADVKSMNIRLKNTSSGEVGSHFYVDEVKNAFANIADLQRQFPDDVLLQSIPLDGKWSSMTAERKMAFTDAFKASLGPRYDSALNHINGVGVDESVVEAIVEAAKSKAAKGLEKTSLGSVNKVLNDIESGLKKATKPFRDAADAAEAALPDTAPAQLRAQVRDEAYAAAKEAAPPSYTIKDINKIKTELGKDFDDWSSKHGGEWTPVQMGVYNDFKGVVYDEAATFSANNGVPIHAQLTELDKLFMVAATMSKGVANDAAKKALQSPVGRDLLSQFALGAFAIGNPIGAALFAVGSAGLRGIYNSRGEGFIADMAAKLSRGVVANPQAAAAVAAQSIYSARRPVVLGYNAERLVDSEPKDYSAIVKSVRELNESRESVIADIRSKTSGLSPEEQTAAVDGLDKMMNDLAMNVPPGLSVPGQLSQQQKNYVVYAKSMLSPAYAVQVLVNGGTGGAAAAKALSDLGANGEGKLFLDTLANELKKHVDESDDRKTAESAAAAYASIAKMVKSTTVARIHSKSGLAMPRPKLMPGPKAPVIKAGSANRFVAGAVTVK